MESRDNRTARHRIQAAELLVLRALCTKEGGRTAFDETMARLKDYQFLQPEHQLLFDCIRQFPAASSASMRAELPRLLINCGFPEFALDSYFEPITLSAAEVVALLDDLRIATRA